MNSLYPKSRVRHVGVGLRYSSLLTNQGDISDARVIGEAGLRLTRQEFVGGSERSFLKEYERHRDWSKRISRLLRSLPR